jgi:hypothetical protein
MIVAHLIFGFCMAWLPRIAAELGPFERRPTAASPFV